MSVNSVPHAINIHTDEHVCLYGMHVRFQSIRPSLLDAEFRSGYLVTENCESHHMATYFEHQRLNSPFRKGKCHMRVYVMGKRSKISSTEWKCARIKTALYENPSNERNKNEWKNRHIQNEGNLFENQVSTCPYGR